VSTEVHTHVDSSSDQVLTYIVFQLVGPFSNRTKYAVQFDEIELRMYLSNLIYKECCAAPTLT
jgi:hypothetical protein